MHNVLKVRENKDILLLNIGGALMDMMRLFQYICSGFAVACLVFTYYHMLKKDQKDEGGGLKE